MKTKTSIRRNLASAVVLTVITVTALTGCSAAEPVNSQDTMLRAPSANKPTPQPMPVETPQPETHPVAKTAVASEVQTVEFDLASTVTAVPASSALNMINTNVSAIRNTNGSVTITIATADGSKVNGNISADLTAYACTDGYSFSASSAPFMPAAGLFPKFVNSSSETVTLESNAFTDHHPGCLVRAFQLTGGDPNGGLHAENKISGAPSFSF